MVRALSRAARKQETIEFGLSGSKVRNLITFSRVGVAKREAKASSSPEMLTSGCHCSLNPLGRSSIICRLTSTKRATLSARSMYRLSQ